MTAQCEPVLSHEPLPLSQAGPWDAVSSGYDEATRPYLAKFSTVGLEALGLTKDMRLLDVACGPGTFSLLAAPMVGSVTAVDISAQMLKLLRRHITEEKISNITVVEADGQNLLFEDASFERAVSMFGLMFFTDRLAGMRQMHRVLRPGGRALISSWAPLAQSFAMGVVFEAVRILDPTREAPVTDIRSLENPQVLHDEMVSAGFDRVTVSPAECEMEAADADAFWEAMLKGALPLVLLRKNLGSAEWAAREPQARDYVRSALSNGERLFSTAYLGYGEKRVF
jgi:ubiquinone/menaquinone biosynthesis C-methylase UbiE